MGWTTTRMPPGASSSGIISNSGRQRNRTQTTRSHGPGGNGSCSRSISRVRRTTPAGLACSSASREPHRGNVGHGHVQPRLASQIAFAPAPPATSRALPARGSMSPTATRNGEGAAGARESCSVLRVPANLDRRCDMLIRPFRFEASSVARPSSPSIPTRSQRDRRTEQAQLGAFPPVPRAPRREPVEFQACSNVPRRPAGERVVAEQGQDRRRAFEQPLLEPEEPGLGTAVSAQRGEPHLPVEPGQVEGREPRPPVELAGLPAEAVRPPGPRRRRSPRR